MGASLLELAAAFAVSGRWGGSYADDSDGLPNTLRDLGVRWCGRGWGTWLPSDRPGGHCMWTLITRLTTFWRCLLLGCRLIHRTIRSSKSWVALATLHDFKVVIIVRRAGLLWSQQDFEWRWSVPLFKCLIVLEFSFILFDLCLLITFFNFIMNYVPIVTFWIFTYHKIWILSIMFCFIWSYWIIYFLACLEVSWRVVS